MTMISNLITNRIIRSCPLQYNVIKLTFGVAFNMPIILLLLI